MGLAIDGNIVHGIARGGQAFVSLESAAKDGSINIGGNNYYPFAENPSGEYTISGVFGDDITPLSIDFTISKNGKLTVNSVSVSSDKGPLESADIEKKPL